MNKFQGKRALVTGGGAGIGRGLALRLAELGAEVYAVSLIAEELKSLEKENPKIKTITLDITDYDKVRKILGSLAPIHLLVNNAGTTILNHVLDATGEEFDKMFNLNVKALINVSQVVAKGLIESKVGGRIVNISSQAGIKVLKDHLIYCASKASVDMVTKVFALELGPHNIRVNSVNPTVVMTAMGKLAWSDPVKASGMLGKIPQGRFAEVEEVVNAVVYLLGDESEMVNGHSLPVDGGFVGCN